MIAPILLATLLTSSNIRPGELPCADTINKFAKANTLQEASYKPRLAKEGIDGDARFWAIRLLHSARHGGNGKKGRHGHDLKVYVTAIPGGDSILLKLVIKVEGSRKSADTFYVNPLAGRILVIADGGNGGSGGNGEAGLPAEGKKSASEGGSGGDGGKGGHGGSIRIFFDSTALAYVHCDCLQFSNFGGSGGRGGNGAYGAGEYSSSKNSDGSPGMDGNPGPRILFENTKGVVLRMQ